MCIQLHDSITGYWLVIENFQNWKNWTDNFQKREKLDQWSSHKLVQFGPVSVFFPVLRLDFKTLFHSVWFCVILCGSATSACPQLVLLPPVLPYSFRFTSAAFRSPWSSSAAPHSPSSPCLSNPVLLLPLPPLCLRPVTVTTLYALMCRYPICFSLFLYYDATLPMLDWYGHHHSIMTTTSCITPCLTLTIVLLTYDTLFLCSSYVSPLFTNMVRP